MDAADRLDLAASRRAPGLLAPHRFTEGRSVGARSAPRQLECCVGHREELMPTLLATTAVAKAEMLIRRPVKHVFEAFVDPRITKNFWFTRGSRPLEPGKQITWEWGMHNLSVGVTVKAIEQDKRILIEWSSKGSAPTI